MVRVKDLRALHFARMLSALRRLSMLCEDKKKAGMPANEAARVNQYGMYMHKHINLLTNLKEYRTPQVLRSMSRFAAS